MVNEIRAIEVEPEATEVTWRVGYCSNGMVGIEMGEDIIMMSPEQARALAARLVANAGDAEKVSPLSGSIN